MTVGIIGLGLIGGSVARALKAFTDDTVLGADLSRDTFEEAMLEGCLDGELTDEAITTCDCMVVALYPQAAVDTIRSKAHLLKPGCLVTDVCGLKRGVCAALEGVAQGASFDFIGVHPMAGRERGGFANSTADLFRGASLIVTPYPWQGDDVVQRCWSFYRRLGFGTLKQTTPSEHDTMIAYTSQLAHLLTVAYMLDPLAANHEGFSAGSFRDMTRVARINEYLWSELFIDNADCLCPEAERLAQRILTLSQAARDGDRDALISMLRQSRLTKEAMLEGERAGRQGP